MYQDAGDIFQAVCVDLLSKLPQLREHRALPKWLMQSCYRECLHHWRTGDRLVELETSADIGNSQFSGNLAEKTLLQLEEEQTLRDAISEMPARCGQMIHMLFFEISPARPYAGDCQSTRPGGRLNRLHSRSLSGSLEKAS